MAVEAFVPQKANQPVQAGRNSVRSVKTDHYLYLTLLGPFRRRRFPKNLPPKRSECNCLTSYSRTCCGSGRDLPDGGGNARLITARLAPDSIVTPG